jgi:hypothetical protein
MKTVFCVISMSLIILFSCRNEQKTSSEAIAEKEPIEEENEASEDIEYQKGNFRAFHFRCIDNCGNKGATFEQMNAHGLRQAFDIVKTIEDSTLFLEFSFIDDCCLRHQAIANIENKVLQIDYKNISQEVCDCHCEYRYLYKTRYFSKFDSIMINDTLIIM